MARKDLYLNKLDAIKRTLESLPDDCSVCSISDTYPAGMRIQILEHPAVKGERKEFMAGGQWWCEVPGEVVVGYCEKVQTVACQCSVCDEPIYVGDPALLIDGYGWVCHDCAESAKKIVEG